MQGYQIGQGTGCGGCEFVNHSADGRGPWPGQRIVTAQADLVAGVAELACAYGLLTRRRWAGPASAVLLLAVWPSNLQFALAAPDALGHAVKLDVAEREAMLGSEEARHNAAVMANELRSAAAAAAAEAERSEIEWRLRMGLLEARARERAAAATRAERRLMGGTGEAAVDPVSGPELDVFNRLVDSGMSEGDAAVSAGIDPRVVGSLGSPRFAETSTGPEAVRDAELSAALGRLEALIPADPDEDIPGIGMTGVLPAPLLSDEGRALREEAENVIDLLGRSRTGANMPAEELETYRRLLLGSAETDAGLRRGVARLRDLIGGRTVRDREGRTADEVTGDALAGLRRGQRRGARRRAASRCAGRGARHRRR